MAYQVDQIVQVLGSLDSTGTVGTILGIGGTVQVAGASAGTFVNISTGTQQTLGTVGIVNTGTLAQVTSVSNLASGTLLNSGSSTGVGVVTSISNLVAGTLLNSGTTTGVGVVSVLSLGTVRQSFPSFKFISAAGTTTISSAAGIVHSVVIGSCLGGGTLYNSAGTSAAVIWAVTTPVPQSYIFDLAYGSLTWAGTGVQAITINYL